MALAQQAATAQYAMEFGKLKVELDAAWNKELIKVMNMVATQTNSIGEFRTEMTNKEEASEKKADLAVTCKLAELKETVNSKARAAAVHKALTNLEIEGVPIYQVRRRGRQRDDDDGKIIYI